MDQVSAERRAPDFRRLDGLAEPEAQVVTREPFFLEYLSADGADTVYHVFAVPEYKGPWAPPDGVVWMHGALARFKDEAHLPYSDGQMWCQAEWDTEGLPALTHFAIRMVDDIVGQWLVSLGIGPERATSVAVLQRMQDALFPLHARGGARPSFLMGRLALLERFRNQSIREVLAGLKQPIPDGADPDMEVRKAIDLLFPLRPGMWFLCFRALHAQVTDHKILAETFLNLLG